MIPELVSLSGLPANTPDPESCRAPDAPYDTVERLRTLGLVVRSLRHQRDREVIAKRFGLNGEEPQTLREIGDHYAISVERVRQIEKRALRRLRYPPRSRILRDFLGGTS